MKPDCPECSDRHGTPRWVALATVVAALLAAIYLVQVEPTPPEGRVATVQWR
jgi:hypothetical protein